MPRIVHAKVKTELAEIIPAKNGQFMNVRQKVPETKSPPQPPNSTRETRTKTLMRILFSLRTEVQPRYIQGTINYGEVSRGAFTKRTVAPTMHTRMAITLYRLPFLAAWPSSVVMRKSTQRPMEAITQKKAS